VKSVDREGEGAHIFRAILIDRQMDGTKGAPSDLLLDDVLVNPVLRSTVILACRIFGAGIESFLSATPVSRCSSIVL
jgi:hypothetical protein